MIRKRDITARYAKRLYGIFLPRRQKWYAYFLLGLVILCAIVQPHPVLAMWVTFALAAYSAIANDSIQTIGTFISSNKRVKWYYLWIHMGAIFVLTLWFSWYYYGGDISYGRLQSPGLDMMPESYSFLQLLAPIVLLALTRWRMPVSTSILLLSAFSTKASSIASILSKSLLGYFLAFVLGLLMWLVLSYFFSKFFRPTKQVAWYWVLAQWIISGCLWSVWVMQDMANIAVVLPRQLTVGQLIAVLLYVVLGLGLLFYLRGDRIQRLVEEKSNVTDVRTATIIDMSYALLLYYLKVVSVIPISTTWVFIGLLGGRELGLSLGMGKRKRWIRAWRFVGKDAAYAGIGLIVSLIIAVGVSASLRASLFAWLGF